MSQATAGVTFDLLWQTSQWREQMAAAQADMEKLAAEAERLRIPVTIDEAALTTRLDALIAEMETTRSIDLQVNVVPGAMGTMGAVGHEAAEKHSDASTKMLMAAEALLKVAAKLGGHAVMEPAH
jgi:hypothetical protein